MLVDRAVRGAVAGLAATVPMTVLMQVLHQRLPWRERYPLPPAQITSRLTRATGVERRLRRHEHRVLTMVSHFGYGSAAGAAYTLLARRVPLPSWLSGIGFGLGVWTTSYLGWLPALQLLPPATEHPARRNAVMIAAHVVWGASLGIVTQMLEQGRVRRARPGTPGGLSPMSSDAQLTTDHETIRRWAEARGGRPAMVRGTGAAGEPGVLRIDFAEGQPDENLEPISWDEWFRKFEDARLAFLYQDTTARGQGSRFCKLVSRESAAQSR
jgi:uncharacterized membrane protein YagU involved in acid resistance